MTVLEIPSPCFRLPPSSRQFEGATKLQQSSASIAEASYAMPRRSTLPTQVQYPEDREQGCARTGADPLTWRKETPFYEWPAGRRGAEAKVYMLE